MAETTDARSGDAVSRRGRRSKPAHCQRSPRKRRECDRRCGGNLGAPAREGGADGGGQPFTVEALVAGEGVEVEEVAHAAVLAAEHDEGVDLLRHRRFRTAHGQARARQSPSEGFGIELAEARQIRVWRRPDRLAQPDQEQQCTLDHEALRVRRMGQPIQQPLDGMAGEDEVQVHAERMAMTHEARLHGSRQARARASTAST